MLEVYCPHQEMTTSIPERLGNVIISVIFANEILLESQDVIVIRRFSAGTVTIFENYFA